MTSSQSLYFMIHNVELNKKTSGLCNTSLTSLTELHNLIKKQNQFSLSDPIGLWREESKLS